MLCYIILKEVLALIRERIRREALAYRMGRDGDWPKLKDTLFLDETAGVHLSSFGRIDSEQLASNTAAPCDMCYPACIRLKQRNNVLFQKKVFYME